MTQLTRLIRYCRFEPFRGTRGCLRMDATDSHRHNFGYARSLAPKTVHIPTVWSRNLPFEVMTEPPNLTALTDGMSNWNVRNKIPACNSGKE
jgi:hypothetical protein